jgi:hypothetical protein
MDKCTAAWKLVSSLKDMVAVARADKTYPKWSDQFLTFCERTADATTKHLQEQSKDNADPAIPIAISLNRLSFVIKGWELLHTFIKPVLDADNLKVPYPLVHFLTEHVGELQAVKEARFVIEISPELNYFQHRHTRLRKALDYLQPLVKGPMRAQRVGFLALPCSQFKGLFMNCLLYHEVGHFIAEEAGILLPEDRTKLHNELEASFHEYLYWAEPIIDRMMEELFADLVAVKLIGIAYTLSYIELLRLVTDLSPNQLKTFDIDHPADALRFREQLKVLRKDRWSKYGKGLPHWNQLQEIAKIPDHEYSVPSDYEDDPEMSQVWAMLIEHLCKPERLAGLHKRVDTLLSDRPKPCERYTTYAKGIKECLGHGIVPSNEQGGSIPHPLAIINGGTLFLLSEMSDLYSTVPKRSARSIEDRAFLENRVEMWCLKAIEDWLIIKKSKAKSA